MTKIVNGHKEEYHLCSVCAQDSAEYQNIKNNMNFGIGDFLTGMFTGGKNSAISEPATDVCPTCKMPYNDFLKRGKLGCGDCYTAFAGKIKRPLRQIHGAAEHMGKVPKRGGGELLISRKISALEEELSVAVQKQDFERAAKLRDEILDIKAQSERGEA